MNFKANSGIWGTMFGVPCIVADNLLKLATGEQLKVLLYILRCSGRACSDEEISRNTGVTPQQASEALMFWQQVNVLSSDASAIGQGSIMQMNMQPQPSSDSVKPQKLQPAEEPKKAPVQRQKQNLTPTEITCLMKESDDISELFKTAEGLLGTLNHTHQNSLIWMFSYLGLKKEVIITLLSYCVSIEKTNAGYIEKIAYSWSENEINTLDSAQDEVSRMTKARDYTYKIMSAFEMKRNPTAKQMNFIADWQKESYSIELIHYAYEKTIEQIDRLSFEYINKILVSWKDSGYATVKNVKDAEDEYKKRRKSTSASNSDDDFDVDKYKIFINKF